MHFHSSDKGLEKSVVISCHRRSGVREVVKKRPCYMCTAGTDPTELARERAQICVDGTFDEGKYDMLRNSSDYRSAFCTYMIKAYVSTRAGDP